MRHTGFIDLQRRFFRVLKDPASEQSLRELGYPAHISGASNELTWRAILQEPRVVVLGEPGSGKTEEFRHQLSQLSKSGHIAFFVDLLELVSHRLIEIVDRKGQRSEFDSWLSSTKPAWFFLDAVDESRLVHPSNFRIALENFARDLETRVRDRAHVLLSSRISTWRSESDLTLFESLLASESLLTNETIDSPEPVSAYIVTEPTVRLRSKASRGAGRQSTDTSVVAIAPLDLMQIEKFVDYRGENGSRFIKELVAQFLEPLSRRPLDVENLLRYWRDKGGFGSYLEMLAYSVSHGLKEPNTNVGRELLSPGRAQEGAEILASMVLFCRRRDIALHDDFSEALRPSAALPSTWAVKEVESLLDRALFDAPLYGRVRFHHRETEEYLTACWLQWLTSNNLPVHVLKRQLFEEIPGHRLMLRPAMAPVAAWIACFNSDEAKQVRGWLRQAEPEVFFRAADPSQLPLDFRRSILDAIVESYKDWEFSRIDVDRAALTRLADPGLSSYLAQKCLDKDITDDLRSKFFYMADFGKLPGLEETALAIIIDEHESNRIKDAACDYLAAVQDAPALNRLAAALPAISSPSESLVASLLIALFPRFISGRDAIGLIKRLDSIEQYSTSLQFPLKDHFTKRCAPDEVIALIVVLNDLLSDGPPWLHEDRDKYRVGTRFIALGDVLAELLASALSKTPLTEAQVSILAKAVWLIVYLSGLGKINRLDDTELRTMLAEHEAVRQGYVRYSLDVYRQAHGNLDRVNRLFIFSISSPILQHQDSAWLLKEIRAAQSDVAACLLRVLEDLWASAEYPSEVRRTAKRVMRLKEFDESERLPHFPSWISRERHRWYGKFRHTLGNRYWWSRRRRNMKLGLLWWRNQWTLFKLLPRIRSGEHKGALWFLANELKEKDSSHLARTGWTDLRTTRGRHIESAARRGMIAYWPRFTPLLKHERSYGDSSIDVGVIIGLTGIHEALFAQELDFASIGETEAQHLARYALNEINGFPEWFRDLAVAHLNPVQMVLMSAVEHEWLLRPELEHVHGVLAQLSYDQTGAYASFLEPVLQRLETSDPVHPTVLSQVLRLAMRMWDGGADRLRNLAKERARAYPASTSQHMEWMTLLLHLDVAAALDALESLLNDVPDPKAYSVRLASALSSGNGFAGLAVSSTLYQNSSQVRRLILLLFKHLPPASDPTHPVGKAHSVSCLDAAASFRDSLVGRLGDTDDNCAGQVLDNLLNQATLESRRDWIRYLILRRRRRLADMDPWTEEQIRIFQERYETAPRNPRELFRLTCDRLQDIKDWVETGEDSPRGELHAGNTERDVRVWVARKLKERARGLYTIPEEHELASGKRQDIRIEAPGIPGSVVIEVKQKEGSSFPKLLERLENQLIGDYLKAPNARFGIFLVSFTAHAGKGSTGIDPATGETLTFSDIIHNLQKHADVLGFNNLGVDEVKVFGIDFVNS